VAQDVELAEELWERSCLWTGCDRQKSTAAIGSTMVLMEFGAIFLALNSTEIAAITKQFLSKFYQNLPSIFCCFVLLG